MKLWQHLEIWGAGAVLAGLLFQFFVAVEIQERRQETDEAILEQRLTHIYRAIRDQGPQEPKWDEIEDFYAGRVVPGDASWRFEEAERAIKLLAAFLFVVGSLLAVVGKAIQFSEENRSQSQGNAGI